MRLMRGLRETAACAALALAGLDACSPAPTPSIADAPAVSGSSMPPQAAAAPAISGSVLLGPGDSQADALSFAQADCAAHGLRASLDWSSSQGQNRLYGYNCVARNG